MCRSKVTIEFQLSDQKPCRHVGYMNNGLHLTLKIVLNYYYHLVQKGARIFARGHYLLREANSFNFLEPGSRESGSFKEQIMSNDKYPIIFSPQMEAILFIILHMFFATPKVLNIIHDMSWL